MAEPNVSQVANIDRIELILSQLEKLPTLPAVATRLLQLVTASDSNAKEVVDLISADQSLTAKIISLAQRASYGGGLGAPTVERAVMRLGFQAVRNAVLSIKVFETFGHRKQDMLSTAFDRAEFWKHSLGVACTTRLLAQAVSWRVDPEEAFVCGLLHDLGKVALSVALPKSYARILRATIGRWGCIAEVERHSLGLDHAVAGRRLAQRWQLPQAMVDVMWLHHCRPDALPPNLTTANIVKLVYLADLVVREQRIGFSGNHVFLDRATDVAAAFGIKPDRFAGIVENLAKQIHERAGIIGLSDLTSERLYTRAMAQANDELSQMNQTLAQANATLRRRAEYFEAMVKLTESLSTDASVGDACQGGARTLREVLDVPAVLLCMVGNDHTHGHMALVSAEHSRTDLVDPGELSAARDALGPVSAGWFVPPLPGVQPVLTRFAGELGPGPYWLLPLHSHGQVVAFAALSLVDERFDALKREASDLAALLASIGLVVASAQARNGAQRLAEDLAQANQQVQHQQAALLRARSLEAIAAMASGAGHELNTPLAVISGRAQQLQGRDLPDDVAELLATMERQAHRCAEIVSDLMDFAQPTPPSPVGFDVGSLCEALRRDWAERAGLRQEQFAVEIPPDLPQAYADPVQVRAILDELISNAVDSVEANDLQLAINCHPDMSDETITIVVQDNGCGMAPDVLGRALDPFFSSQPAGRKRGLGLALAARLAQSNAGALWLESEPKRGTTAFVRLPASQAD